MNDLVTIKRKIDGKYLVAVTKGHATYAEVPRAVKSRAKAEMLIRVDVGASLDEFEIEAA